MMEQLDELYRDVILDHFKNSTHVGELSDATILNAYVRFTADEADWETTTLTIRAQGLGRRTNRRVFRR